MSSAALASVGARPRVAPGRRVAVDARRATAARRGVSATVRASALNDRIVDDANAAFAIPGSVEFVAGEGGLPKCVLTHKNGGSAEVYLFGACVTSWCVRCRRPRASSSSRPRARSVGSGSDRRVGVPSEKKTRSIDRWIDRDARSPAVRPVAYPIRCQPSGDDVLYVRPDAVFDKSKPISGGAPLCFPRFGPSDEMQQHGFARNSDWTVISSSADPNPDDPEPSVMFKLRDSEYTREMWDHAFEATYEVTLRRESLRMEFSVRNPLAEERKGRHEDAPFDFTAAIHTYIEVADATSPNVFARGLIGKNYIDKAIDPNVVHPEICAGDVVFGTSLCDKVFLKTEPETDLHVGTGAAVCVENTRGWTDTVVWNPHETLNIGDAWKKFVCVESAAVSEKIVLDSGKVWTAETNMFVADVD